MCESWDKAHIVHVQSHRLKRANVALIPFICVGLVARIATQQQQKVVSHCAKTYSVKHV